MPYSKGPWTSTFRINKERGVRNEGGFICFLPQVMHYPGQDQRYEEELIESKHNAHLIAAAPDLLAACIEAKRMYEELEPAGGWQGVFEELESAIKKAIE
jgi:hypothetical protein